MPRPPFDEGLLRRLLQEQRRDEACQHIIVALGPEVLGFLRGVIGSPHEADDLFQDVCDAIWRGLPTFAQKSSVRTWVYAIAHHKVMQKHARYSRAHVVRLDTERAVNLPGSSGGAAFRVQAQKEELRWIQDQLKPAERELYILRVTRDMDYDEIGQILEIQPDAAKERYHRLTKRLEKLSRRAGVAGQGG